MLVGADADMIDPDDLGHLRYTVEVFVEVREKVPDSDRAAGLGGIGPDRPRSRKVGSLPFHIDIAKRRVARLDSIWR